jgi:hypothetical protein
MTSPIVDGAQEIDVGDQRQEHERSQHTVRAACAACAIERLKPDRREGEYSQTGASAVDKENVTTTDTVINRATTRRAVANNLSASGHAREEIQQLSVAQAQLAYILILGNFSW